MRQPLLPFEEWKPRDVLAVEFEEVEGKIDESTITRVRGLLHQLERGHAVVRTPHSFQLMYAVFTGSLAKAAAGAGYLAIQSSPDRMRS